MTQVLLTGAGMFKLMIHYYYKMISVFICLSLFLVCMSIIFNEASPRIVSTETIPALLWVLKCHRDYKFATPHITPHAVAGCSNVLGNNRITATDPKESDVEDYFYQLL